MMDPLYYNSTQSTNATEEPTPGSSQSSSSSSSFQNNHDDSTKSGVSSTHHLLLAHPQIRGDVGGAQTYTQMTLSPSLLSPKHVPRKDSLITSEKNGTSFHPRPPPPIKDASYHPATVSATSAAQLLLANHKGSEDTIQGKLTQERSLLELKSSTPTPFHGSQPYPEDRASQLFQNYSGFNNSQVYYQSPTLPPPQNYGRRGEYHNSNHHKGLLPLTSSSSASRHSSQRLSSITSTLANRSDEHKQVSSPFTTSKLIPNSIYCHDIQSTPIVLPHSIQYSTSQHGTHISGYQGVRGMSGLDGNSSDSTKLIDYRNNYTHSKLKRAGNPGVIKNTYKGSESQSLGSSDTSNSKLFTKGDSNSIMDGVVDTLTRSSNNSAKAILTFDIDNSGCVPQIVMNPWDTGSAPGMTPLANAIHTPYSQQWQLVPAISGCGDNGGHNSATNPSSDPSFKTQEYSSTSNYYYYYGKKVICVPPDDEMGFLIDLPPPCNVILQPSSIGLSGKIPDSPFQIAFLKFLKGEQQSNSQKIPSTPEHEAAQLPGKKAYVPPYTPKSKSVSRADLYIGKKESLSRPEEELPPQSVDSSRVILTSNNNNNNSSSSSSSSKNKNYNLAPKSPLAKKKRGRGKSLDRVTQHLHRTRGTKARRAKEISFSKRLIQEKLLLDENEEGMDMGVSESDEDVSWTPYSDKNGKRGKRVVELGGGNSSSYSLKIKKHRDSRESIFKEGDFLMRKRDLSRKIPPIFRVNPKKTIQKYVPERKNDADNNWIYRSTGSFIELDVENMYDTILVECLMHDGQSEVVKVLQRPRGSLDSELHKRSIAETSQFQDNFEVFIQALLSQSLDANFLNEVYAEKDDYFVSNIQSIDSVTLSRKGKITSGIRVTSRFLTGIMTWPCFNDLGSSVVGDVSCGSCEVEPAKTMIQMFGQPYNQNSLTPVLPNEEAREHRNFSICNSCSRLASLYHRLSHNKQITFQVCSKLVEVQKRRNPNKDTTLLLNELLANDDWLDQQFNKIQELWAEADSFIR